jgi:hypothetical protein
MPENAESDDWYYIDLDFNFKKNMDNEMILVISLIP